MAPASDNTTTSNSNHSSSSNNNNSNNFSNTSNNFVSAATAITTAASSSFSSSPSNNTAINNNNNNNNNNNKNNNYSTTKNSNNFNPLSNTLNLSNKKIIMSNSQPVAKKESGQSPTSSTSSTTPSGAPSTTQTTNKDDKPITRFENEGVVFKAKLIGSELVMEPRGDKMCQNSIQRLKAIIKGTNSHKKRILLKISFDGVKVYDEKTNEILHHHSVPQISYIASDDTDSRCFGYVGDVPSKAHQFICFKTGGPAIGVMSEISALFDAELERKKRRDQELKEQSKEDREVEEEPLHKSDDSTSAIVAPVSPSSPTLSSPQQQQPASKHRIPYQHSEELSELFQQPLIAPPPPPAPSAAAPILISAASQPVSQLPAPPVARQMSLTLPPAQEMAAPRRPADPAGLSLDGLNIKDELAGLNVQMPVASPNQTDNYVADRYAVFNEIDSWPSIFESNSSLNESASRLDLLSTSQQQAQYLQYQNQQQQMAYQQQQQQYQQQQQQHLSAGQFGGALGQQASVTAPVPFSLGTPSAGNMFDSSNSLAERAGKPFFGAPPSTVASSAPFSFSMSSGPVLRQKHPTIHRVATLGAPSMASHAHALASQSFSARSSASIGAAAMANNNNNPTMAQNASSSSVFRQLNPFDDDFFA